MGTIKTNAMRILDSNNIEYTEHVLDIKEALDGVTCANMLGVGLDKTFKTTLSIPSLSAYTAGTFAVTKHSTFWCGFHQATTERRQITRKPGFPLCFLGKSDWWRFATPPSLHWHFHQLFAIHQPTIL